MRTRFQPLFLAALCSVAFAACSGGGGSQSALPSTPMTAPMGATAGDTSTVPAASSSPLASPAPATEGSASTASTASTANTVRTTSTSGTVVWQAGTSLGHWIRSNTYQCGTPVQSGTVFSFNLVRSGTSCGRNQANPTDASGNNSRLTDGVPYAWTFHYSDKTPSGSSPGMGYDRDARSLIFQVHPYGGGGPCVGLAFWNGGVVGQAQKWLLTSCSGNVWSGTYTPGEQDDFKIVMTPSQGSAGRLQLYRNGVLVSSTSGANYNNTGGGSGGPWWNFGPYKWRWELANGGGSSMTQVNATISNMTLTRL